ncbi:MAG: hypothetical protein RR538_03895 [Erysipelotrichaceae bacterium]
MLTCAATPLSAKESSIDAVAETTANNYTYLSELDKYVSVKDNKFILNIPENVDISQEVRYAAEQQIAISNQKINENNLTIDPNTKTAHTSSISPRKWGKNDMQFGWNYVRVYIDAGNLRLILAGGVGAVGGALAALATTVGMGAAIGGVTAILGIQASGVKDGIWFDYNFFYQRVTDCGFQ